MTAILLPEGRQSFQNANGDPLVGGKLYTYDTGTATPKTTWADAAQTAPNANPIILDGRGEATVYWSGAYKVILKDSLDNTIWTVDPVQGSQDTQFANTLIKYDKTQAEITAGAVIANYYIPSHDVSGQIVPDRYTTNATPGTTNMTSAWATAVLISTLAFCPVTPLGSNYLITDQISMPNGTAIKGTHRNQYTSGGTKITFAPTTAKSLFVPDGAPSLFRFNYEIEGLYILGNSLSAVGNSIYALDAYGLNKARIANLAISNFRTGVRCYGTINNKFDFVQIQNCYVQNILYDGGSSTTDTWTQMYIGNSPIGVQTNGENVAIRFIAPIFEGIDHWGLNICKESYGFEVLGGYSEDIAVSNTATDAMFRVGFDGAALATAGYQLSVRGGRWVGRNAGGVGSCLRVDFTDGVFFAPAIIGNWTNGVETTANTQTQLVVLGGFSANAVGTIVTDVSKVHGWWPNGVVNSGSRNGINAALRQVAFLNSPTTPLNDYREYTSANVACTGAITAVAQWKVTKVGNHVTLTLPAVSGVAAAQPFFEFGEVLGASFCPVASIAFPCIIQNNGTSQTTPGMIIINSAGNIRVYKDGTAANYTAAANAGLGQGCGTAISWTI